MREQNEIRKSLGRKCRRQLRYAQLYLLALIPFLFVLIFSYVPMGGILLAFKDYSITKGIWKSQWAGMKYFEQLFRIPIFPAILKNKYDLDGIDWSALTGESGYREMKFGGRRMLLAWYRSDTRKLAVCGGNSRIGCFGCDKGIPDTDAVSSVLWDYSRRSAGHPDGGTAFRAYY